MKRLVTRNAMADHMVHRGAAALGIAAIAQCRGHPAGDFLEAYLWRVVERGPGWLKVDAHLPDHARNPRGQLFGGFTPTYVDLISLFAARTRKR